MSIPYQKWRDEHVLFLDDAFDCDDTHGDLEKAGYKLERFCEHFLDSNGSRAQGVPDERVLRYCNRSGWILVTHDSNIVRMNLGVVRECSRLGILATSHHKDPDVTVWTRSLASLKPQLERNSFRKRQRPWFGLFDRNGCLKIKPVT